MNWQQPKILALALRDQGLADCLAARLNLRTETWLVSERRINLAHVVVAKCQQAVEKLVKGYLLFHSGTFDPSEGHTPFTEALAASPKIRSEINDLCAALNRLDRRVVGELKWLEGLAPHPPEVASEERGKLIALQKIVENTEYAYWSTTANGLVIAAQGLLMNNQGVRAIKAVRTFLQALARSGPEAFTKDIGRFLDDHPFSIAPT